MGSSWSIGSLSHVARYISSGGVEHPRRGGVGGVLVLPQPPVPGGADRAGGRGKTGAAADRAAADGRAAGGGGGGGGAGGDAGGEEEGAGPSGGGPGEEPPPRA